MGLKFAALLGLLCFLPGAYAAEIAEATALARHVAVGERYMGIRLLGTLRLASTKIGGIRLAGLSALAWDEDEQVLYAVSDLGKLFHLLPRFREGRLDGVQVVAAHALADSQGRALRYPWKDAEGLVLENAANGVKGDSRLLVSYERRPRIRRYTAGGKRLGSVRLPLALRHQSAYRDANQALEAIALHPHWGLLTAPEAALRGQRHIALYALNGRRWQYVLAAAPNSALVAMEALSDGSLLTLERAYVAPLRPLVISLRRVRLLEATATALAEDVAVMNSHRGWRLDNFEGLTRHRDRRFFMVSDDNNSRWQKTLLTYFELL